jgi:1-deoxyxylulose-5-phosphate synthase
MKQIEFSNTGVQVSEMCLGTMMFGGRCDEAESDRILSAAMDRGVNFIDTAWTYNKGETEEILGHIMQGKRDKLFIVTKTTKTDPATIYSNIDDSLQRMQTDHVDTFLIHWPRQGMQPLEMMEALANVVQQGKARFIGASNFPAWLFAHCNAIAERNDWPRLVCNQLPYNLIERGIEVEIFPQAIVEDIAIMVYRPLSMGFLAGKYDPDQPIPTDSRGHTDERISEWITRFGDGLRAFLRFASDHNLHPAQLAIAWTRYAPAVTTPIIGSSSERQLQASLDAFEVDLTDEQYAEVTAMFDTEFKEAIGGMFPPLRRMTTLFDRAD